MTNKKTPNPIDIHVGLRVRLRRTMLNISQEKLGDHCGITFQQIQKYEKGTNRIGASRLQQIAELLKVPVSFFFEGAPDQPAASDTTVPDTLVMLSQPLAVDMLTAFNKLEPAMRRSVLHVVKAAANAPTETAAPLMVAAE